MNKLTEKMVDWLQIQARDANANGLLVGVSGGLDSAVVANLIGHAFPNHSLGVIMPLKSNAEDVADAEQVVKAAAINSVTIDLTETHSVMYRSAKAALQQNDQWQTGRERMTDANLRARLRMSTLYTLASQLNYLVVGTDNAAEWHTGYFTKYGDGGVDLQPIIQLTKTEVKEMAEHFRVPPAVIHKQPSADLWIGQTDEEEMGITYDHIDAYLMGKSIPKADQAIIERMHQQTEHKRKIATQFLYK